ncbi:MAG: stage III sporulation protein AC [Clostridiales bacterium]|nr:stage III sporulation protein AC [Clostridiales bacterium]
MSVDFVFKVAAVGIIVVILNQLLSKSGREEYATLTTIAGIVVVLIMLIPQIENVMRALRSLFGL